MSDLGLELYFLLLYNCFKTMQVWISFRDKDKACHELIFVFVIIHWLVVVRS